MSGTSKFYGTNSTESVELAQQSAVDDLKTSVSEGKALIAEAVTGKGVATASDASFSDMASNIDSISVKTAVDMDILSYVTGTVSSSASASWWDGLSDSSGLPSLYYANSSTATSGTLASVYYDEIVSKNATVSYQYTRSAVIVANLHTSPSYDVDSSKITISLTAEYGLRCTNFAYSYNAETNSIDFTADATPRSYTLSGSTYYASWTSNFTNSEAFVTKSISWSIAVSDYLEVDLYMSSGTSVEVYAPDSL